MNGKLTISVAGLVCALAVLAAIVLPGIGWGLPCVKRNELTFGADRTKWRAPKLGAEAADDPWARYPNFLGGGRKRTGAFPRSAFNPVRSYHPDEYALLKSLSGMRPGKLDFNPGFFGWPALQIYMVGGALKLAAGLGVIELRPDMDFYFQHPEKMAGLYIMGRLVTLLFAAGCVVVVWRAGCRLFGSVGGAAAATLLAAMGLFNVNARYMTADVPMLFWIAMVLWMCTHVLAGGGRKWYVLAGVFLGLAAGTRYQGALGAFVILAAHVLREPRAKLREAVCAKNLWLAAAVSVVVFLLVNPYIVLELGQFADELLGELRGSRSGGAWWRSFLLFAVTGPGVALTMIFAAALAGGLKSRGRKVLFVLAGFGIPAVLLLMANPVMVRYMMPAALVIPLTVGWALGKIHGQGIAQKKKGAQYAAPALALVLVCATAVQAWAHGRIYARPEADTRTRAGEWLADNLPAGASVGVVSIPWQFELPPLDETKYNLVVTDPAHGDWRGRGKMPQYFVSSDLQYPPVGVGGPLSAKERKFWDEVTGRGYAWQVVKRFEAWPAGMDTFLRYGPHDMRYANPAIVVVARTGK